MALKAILPQSGSDTFCQNIQDDLHIFIRLQVSRSCCAVSYGLDWGTGMFPLDRRIIPAIRKRMKYQPHLTKPGSQILFLHLRQLTNSTDAHVSVLVFLSFDLTTTSDILALLIKLAENSDLEIECQKDNSDNYVTNTISLSFKDPVINQTLVRYLKYKKALESSANSSAESASDLQRQLDELLICKK